jgi:hypothetical protein
MKWSPKQQAKENRLRKKPDGNIIFTAEGRMIEVLTGEGRKARDRQNN